MNELEFLATKVMEWRLDRLTKWHSEYDWTYTPVWWRPKLKPLKVANFNPRENIEQAMGLLVKLGPWYIEDDGLGTITVCVRTFKRQGSTEELPSLITDAVLQAKGYERCTI